MNTNIKDIFEISNKYLTIFEHTGTYPHFYHSIPTNEFSIRISQPRWQRTRILELYREFSKTYSALSQT